MELTKLLNNIKVIQVTGEPLRKNISGIFYDSRKVEKGSVFAAIKGYKTDGHKFIPDALNKGAYAVIAEDDSAVPDELFLHRDAVKILVKNSRRALAEISAAFYKEPSKKVKMAGITGTNGKTTTSFILKSIFENSGNKTGLIGTIANYIGDKKVTSKLTTPESNDLNEMLNEMYEQGCSYAVMEVSSHSLVLDRVYKINFAAGVFTNITSDHLDFHGDFGNYFYAKKILFDELTSDSVAVVNADDAHSEEILKDSKAAKLSYGINSNSDVKISDIYYDLNGTTFTLNWKLKNYKISTLLIGEFNAYNAAAAFGTAVSFGFEAEQIIDGIRKTNYVPGRFEVAGKSIKKAVIDYSHTADSLEKALIAIRKIAGTRQIVTVFGCGGDRDKSKRPVMGRVAAEYSDKIIITSDNPRTENPFEIINDITKGINGKNYSIIEDREEAIAAAINNSVDDAVILIAGKGHEDYQERNGIRTHFSDKETAEKYLN